MGYRWVISPIVVEDGVRKPLVATLADPGRAPGQDDLGNPIAKILGHSTVYGSEPWCLSLVHGVDTLAIDGNVEIEDVLEEEYESHPAFVNFTPAGLGWSDQRVSGLRRKLNERGADTKGISNSDPLWLFLQRFAIRLTGRQIDPRELMTRVF